MKNKEARTLKAVSRNCEFCNKLTFTFRKNFYLTGKLKVTKVATSLSQNVSINLKKNQPYAK